MGEGRQLRERIFYLLLHSPAGNGAESQPTWRLRISVLTLRWSLWLNPSLGMEVGWAGAPVGAGSACCTAGLLALPREQDRIQGALISGIVNGAHSLGSPSSLKGFRGRVTGATWIWDIHLARFPTTDPGGSRQNLEKRLDDSIVTYCWESHKAF